MSKFNASTTAERLDRIEEVLGIDYELIDGVEYLRFNSGMLSKPEVHI